MLEINENINGIDVNASLDTGINRIDLGSSGDGKTFFMTLLHEYCIKYSIPYTLINYEFNKDSVKSILNSKSDETSIIVMDNADLYMDDELLSIISKFTNIIFIISIKGTLQIKNCRLYNLEYKGNSIIGEEVII